MSATETFPRKRNIMSINNALGVLLDRDWYCSVQQKFQTVKKHTGAWPVEVGAGNWYQRESLIQTMAICATNTGQHRGLK
eukprot:4385572-Amphidinium_carterae.1